jgi:hypothetical protein
MADQSPLESTALPRIEVAYHCWAEVYWTELDSRATGWAGVKESGIMTSLMGLLLVAYAKNRRNIWEVIAKP